MITWHQYWITFAVLLAGYAVVRTIYFWTNQVLDQPDYFAPRSDRNAASEADLEELKPIDTAPLVNRLATVRQDYRSGHHTPSPAPARKRAAVQRKREEVQQFAFFQHPPPPSPTPPPGDESHLRLLYV